MLKSTVMVKESVSESSETQRLKEWYENFLRLFREELSKLSEEQRQHVLRSNDYHSPCQIEVFWLKQPEWQLIVETHFDNRPDGEITINGPYDSSIFQDEVKRILNLERWNVLVEGESSQQSDPPQYYSDFLAERLHGFVEMAKNAMFSKWEKTRGMTVSLTSKHNTVTHFFGNMGDFDYRALTLHMINESNEQLVASKNVQPASRTPDSKTKYPKGFATYFFPPIIIGKNQKRTVNEILDGVTGTYISPFDKKAFDVTIDGVLVLVERDGFVSVCVDDKTTSLEILNAIMMVSVLDGFDAHVVRDHELSEIEYNPDTSDVVSRTYHYGPIRNQLFNGIPDKILEYKTRHIDEERIKKYFEKTSDICKDKSVSDDLRILLDAMTHMKDSEFFQAFIMGWKIIEKHVLQQWTKKYDTAGKKTKFPTADVMINDLKDELQAKFSDFSELRKLRNISLHDKKMITKNEAHKCVEVSKDLVLKKLQ